MNAASRRQTSDQTGPLILCIDDDAAGLSMRRALLLSQGYRVLTAETGEEALKLFSEHEIDLVVSDHFLQGCTGAELAMKIRSERPIVPIVLVTGSPEKPPSSQYIDAVIIKGSPVTVFLTAIADLVRRP